jgi:hypothetical protein
LSALATSDCGPLPDKAYIINPPQVVTVNEVVNIQVDAQGAASDANARLIVTNQGDGSIETISEFDRVFDTFTFRWTPTEANVDYGLQAEVDGFEPSDPVTVHVQSQPPIGSVTFLDPAEGQGVVFVGKTRAVKVSAAGATGVSLSIVPGDGGTGGSMTESPQGSGTWIWEGWTPGTAGQSYKLVAEAYPESIGNAQIWVQAVDPNGPQIVWPTSSSTLTFGKKAQVVVVAPWDESDVLLKVSRGGTVLEISPKRRYSDISQSVWDFEWIPDRLTQGEPFLLQAYDPTGKYGPSPSVEVGVTMTPDSVSPSIDILHPLDGEKIAQKEQITYAVRVRAKDNQGVTSVTLRITGPETQAPTSHSCGAWCYEVIWRTRTAGHYTIEATATDDSGNTNSTSVGVDVEILSYPMEITQIDHQSFLLRMWDISNPDGAYYGSVDRVLKVDTGVSAAEYVCGIVGYKASGGDIEEERGGREIIRAILTDEGNWKLNVNFKTGVNEWWDLIASFHYHDRPETWDVKILCISTALASHDGPQPGKYVFIETFPNLGHDVYKRTDYQVSDYACGVVGFFDTRGDINEKQVRDPIEVYTYDNGGYWYIRAGFATHGDERQDWTVSLLCIRRQLAAIGGPQMGKPYFFQELPRLNNPVEGSTGVSIDQYACGVVGFRAFGGDINEGNHDHNVPLFWAYLYEHGDGTWHFRGDFRSEGDHEDWEKVTILCALKGALARPYTFDEPYGPGVHLLWSGAPPGEAKYFQVQYKTPGGDWINYTTNREIYDSDGNLRNWINHHGSVQFRTTNWKDFRKNEIVWKEYVHALPSGQEYIYRVRTLAADGETALSDWSREFSGRVPYWSEVELKQPNPLGPYDYSPVVNLQLDKAVGDALNLTWEIEEVGDPTVIYPEGTCAEGPPGGADLCILDIAWGQAPDQQVIVTLTAHSTTNGSEDKEIIVLRKGMAPTMTMNPPNPKWFPVPWGPGMELRWTPTTAVEAKYYEIQFKEGGKDWQVYQDTRRTFYGGWVNHHGGVRSGSYLFALPSNTTYSYRLRALDEFQNPLTDWSSVVSGKSPAWPVRIDLRADPQGPFDVSQADVALWLESWTGDDLEVRWELQAEGGASYQVRSGCQESWTRVASADTCDITISRDGSAASGGVLAKPMLAPGKSVTVRVYAQDRYGKTDYRMIDLAFGTSNPCGNKPCDLGFDDVSDDHWAQEEITVLHEEGYTSGCTADGANFCPDDILNRAAMAVFMERGYAGADYVPEDPSSPYFSDTLTSDWYTNWVEGMFLDGLTSGCGVDAEGKPLFCPDQAQTRAQTTVYLLRLRYGPGYIPEDPPSSFVNVYQDVPLSGTWYSKYVYKAYALGLIQGCDERGSDVQGTFRPEDPITRAEAACMLVRAKGLRPVKAE